MNVIDPETGAAVDEVFQVGDFLGSFAMTAQIQREHTAKATAAERGMHDVVIKNQ